MRRPIVDDALVQASFEELEHILVWVAQRPAVTSGSSTVLIGGWAVYAYNPYWGSYDIDLVTTSRTRHSLMDYLRANRGFSKMSDDNLPFRGIYKPVMGVGDVYIDFATYETRYPFEGVDDSFDFGSLRGSLTVLEMGRLRVPIPDRSMLLVMKLKAARDRQARLDGGRSKLPHWERAKAVKDRADVLALVDQERGGADLDIARLGRGLARYPFLVQTLELCGREPGGIERYGTTAEAARRDVGRVLDLAVGR